MCGIVGTIAHQPVNQSIYDALTVIQHRGQDAAGIMTMHEGSVNLRKANGLVREAIQKRHMLRLQGNMGLGQVRYPTAGTPSPAEAQPLYVNSPYGLALVHNGNLINAEKLKQDLILTDLRHLNTQSDSEVLLNVFAHELQKLGNVKLTAENIFTTIAAVHRRCVGSYAAIVMIVGFGLVAFRDPYGIRPLSYGRRSNEKGHEYLFASESVAIHSLGFDYMGDVKPGEAIVIDLQGRKHQQICAEKTELHPCIFEQVYLARPDSIMDKILVYKTRMTMGEKLAEKILQQFPEHDIDVVIPIPDTSRHSALPLAQTLGVKYREGFVKNRYIGRTFIMPGQSVRQKSVRQKLNAIDMEFKDKNVLLVDDSIVRGTTSKEIIQMARDAGAKKVYFASASPEVRYPNVYGIDMPAAEELVAHNRSLEQIRESIDADWLVYQDLDALYQAAQEGNPAIKRFEDSVFTGDYITGGVGDDYFAELAAKRKDAAKKKYQQLDDLQDLELHNSD